MLKDWWIGYWWILPPLLYLIFLGIVIRLGMWPTVGRKILLASICVFILLIPSTRRWAQGYPFAVLTVLNLLVFIWTGNRQATISSRASDQ